MKLNMTCNLNIIVLVTLEAAGNETNNLQFVIRGAVEFLELSDALQIWVAPRLVVKLVLGVTRLEEFDAMKVHICR